MRPPTFDAEGAHGHDGPHLLESPCPDNAPRSWTASPNLITPEGELVAEGQEPPHHSSITDILDDAAETGVSPLGAEDQAVPGDNDILRAGDPDANPLLNELSGEEAPGGPNPTPNQNDVDAIGRLYGVSRRIDPSSSSAKS